MAHRTGHVGLVAFHLSPEIQGEQLALLQPVLRGHRVGQRPVHPRAGDGGKGRLFAAALNHQIVQEAAHLQLGHPRADDPQKLVEGPAGDFRRPQDLVLLKGLLHHPQRFRQVLHLHQLNSRQGALQLPVCLHRHVPGLHRQASLRPQQLLDPLGQLALSVRLQAGAVPRLAAGLLHIAKIGENGRLALVQVYRALPRISGQIAHVLGLGNQGGGYAPLRHQGPQLLSSLPHLVPRTQLSGLLYHASPQTSSKDYENWHLSFTRPPP